MVWICTVRVFNFHRTLALRFIVLTRKLFVILVRMDKFENILNAQNDEFLVTKTLLEMYEWGKGILIKKVVLSLRGPLSYYTTNKERNVTGIFIKRYAFSETRWVLPNSRYITTLQIAVVYLLWFLFDLFYRVRNSGAFIRFLGEWY